jgi:hypothetical protein
VALKWSWAFGAETPAQMIDMGWNLSTNAAHNATTSDPAYQYTYTGSPTRYSLGVDPDQRSQGIDIPAPACQGLNQGWVQLALKADASSGYENSFKPVIRVTSPGTSRYIEINHFADGSLQLFMDGANKTATGPLDFSTWKVVALQWDMSADPWRARIWVDGVAATAEFTDPAPAAASGCQVAIGGVGPDTNAISYWIGQVIVWDSYADAGQNPYYVTRVEPTSDGTNIGTWTPSTGVDDFAVVDSPFDDTTYTEEASPSALDRVEVTTSSLGTATGVTPASVQGVTAHGFSEGQAITARTVLGDGGATEANGDTAAISATTTTYTYATSESAPSDASAWEATDTLDLIYEVVTV